MKRFLQHINTILGKQLDLRVRLFNVLAISGALVSAIFTVFHFFARSPVNMATCLLGIVLSVALLHYATRTRRYQRAYTITVIGIFLVLFPVMFFTAGGYKYGMPSFFIFAVVFTVFMLEGKRALLLSGLEMAVYVSLCFFARSHPETVNFYKTNPDTFWGNTICFAIVSLALGISLFLHFRLYNAQQKQLDEQNRKLAEINRMKTQLFASVSHEMKTPLTVVSVHIQRAEALMNLNRPGDEDKTAESFAIARDEIMRMSRMVDNSLKLASLQEMGGQHAVLDIIDLLRATAEAYRALLEKRGNTLIVSLPDGRIPVVGSSDMLVQLFSNLLSNAAAGTQNGGIQVSAAAEGDMLSIVVADSGKGIEAELLAHIFERGVSGGGGSGLGLAIAQEIAESHRGEISIRSEPGEGTTVTVSLPIHEEECCDAGYQAVAR